jgi:hypothetical protein
MSADTVDRIKQIIEARRTDGVADPANPGQNGRRT